MEPRRNHFGVNLRSLDLDASLADSSDSKAIIRLLSGKLSQASL